MGSLGLFLNATRKTLYDSRRRLAASRIILLLLLTLSLLMPVTEHVWHGDELLRGGQDVELCLLGALTFCGLVALTAEQVIASPLLLMLLGHKEKRLPVDRVQEVLLREPVEVRCRPQGARRCIDLTIPMSLMCLRV